MSKEEKSSKKAMNKMRDIVIDKLILNNILLKIVIPKKIYHLL